MSAAATRRSQEAPSASPDSRHRPSILGSVLSLVLTRRDNLNWRALAFESAHVRSLNTCDVVTCNTFFGLAAVLAQNSFEIWACDLLTVQTLWFRTLFVFFVITTVLDRLCTRGSPRIRTRAGWPSMW